MNLTVDEQRDMFNKVTQMHTVLIGVEGHPEDGVMGRQRDTEKRVRRLEKYALLISGAAIFCGGLIEYAYKTLSAIENIQKVTHFKQTLFAATSFLR